jgi:peroxiredoxin
MQIMKLNRLLHVQVLVTLSLMLMFFSGISEALNIWPIEEKIGNPAPNFLIKDLKGNKITLSSFKGKPLLLNFWASWCPYCRKEKEHLNTLYNEYKDRGLVIVSISTDKSVSKVKKYLQKIPSEFIILSDLQGEVSAKYGVTALPTSFLITHNGKIKHKFLGYREWTSNGLKKIINSLVGS